jgi:hypothetical protein
MPKYLVSEAKNVVFSFVVRRESEGGSIHAKKLVLNRLQFPGAERNYLHGHQCLPHSPRRRANELALSRR